MPDQRTDKKGFSTVNSDEERDMAAKGGPTTGLGIADDAHDVPHPYDEDTQTQLAAKSTKKKTGETLNDDWKTGMGANENPDKSSTDSDTSSVNPDYKPTNPNYNKSGSASNDSMGLKEKNIGNEKHKNK